MFPWLQGDHHQRRRQGRRTPRDPVFDRLRRVGRAPGSLLSAVPRSDQRAPSLGSRRASPNIVHAEISARGPHWLGLILGAMWDRRDDRLYAGIGNPRAGRAGAGRGHATGRHTGAEALSVTAPAADADLARRRRGARVRRRRRARRPVRWRTPTAPRPPRARRSASRARAPIPCSVPGFNVDRRLLSPAGAPRAGPAARRARRQRRRAWPGRGRHAWGRGRSQPQARLGFDGVAQIGGIDHALLLRFVAAAVEPLGGAPVPFDEMVSPTGGNGSAACPTGCCAIAAAWSAPRSIAG